LTGFNDNELIEALAKETLPDTFDADVVPDLQSEPVSRTGDVWTLGQHRLLCGDGTNPADLAVVLEGKSCNMVFCDPPYNSGGYHWKGPGRMTFANDNLGEEFGTFLRSACDAMLAVSNGAIYICMSSSELARLQTAFRDAGGHWSTWLILGEKYVHAGPFRLPAPV
jgi:DNA modification methylase